MKPLHIQQIEKAYQARRVFWLVALFMLAIFIWAAFSQLDEVIVGQGVVVPSQSVQKIQSLEGGIVKDILVTEGQIVEQGEVLLSLDNTRYRSAFREIQQQLEGLTGKQTLYRMQLSSILVNPSADGVAKVSLQLQPIEKFNNTQAITSSYQESMQQLSNQLQQAHQKILQQQARLAEEQSRTQSLQKRLISLNQELKLIKEMVADGVVAKLEQIQLERQQQQMQGDIKSAELLQKQLLLAIEQGEKERLNIALSFRSETQAKLDEAENQLLQLKENQPAIADALARTELRSPVHGIVKQITIRSFGGVVKPGEPMMEIVPLDDKLIVEAKISPKDIAYLQEGLPAMVKFSAFDFVIYGGLSGKLTHISPDSLQTPEGDTYFKVYIETEDKKLNNKPLIPGMQASVDILTGQKTVLSYWLKPLLRAKASALREP